MPLDHEERLTRALQAFHTMHWDVPAAEWSAQPWSDALQAVLQAQRADRPAPRRYLVLHRTRCEYLGKGPDSWIWTPDKQDAHYFATPELAGSIARRRPDCEVIPAVTQ